MRTNIRLLIRIASVGAVLLLILPELLTACSSSGSLATQNTPAPTKKSISPISTLRATAASSSTSLSSFQHIFLIVMENSNYNTLIGNANMPWINNAAHTYVVATNYYGVGHPSEPNYIALTSGSTQGVTSDADVTLNAPSIVDHLEA